VNAFAQQVVLPLHSRICFLLNNRQTKFNML
jgi:hypothetical protein